MADADDFNVLVRIDMGDETGNFRRADIEDGDASGSGFMWGSGWFHERAFKLFVQPAYSKDFAPLSMGILNAHSYEPYHPECAALLFRHRFPLGLRWDRHPRESRQT